MSPTLNGALALDDLLDDDPALVSLAALVVFDDAVLAALFLAGALAVDLAFAGARLRADFGAGLAAVFAFDAVLRFVVDVAEVFDAVLDVLVLLPAVLDAVVFFSATIIPGLRGTAL